MVNLSPDIIRSMCLRECLSADQKDSRDLIPGGFAIDNVIFEQEVVDVVPQLGDEIEESERLG